MGWIRNAAGTLALGLAVGTAAQAQECVLDVVDSFDAVRGELSYYIDTDLLQAVLVSHHRYSDGSTLIAISPTTCENGKPDRCLGLAVEGLGATDERTYWLTEILRAGDTITVNTSGFLDAALTQGVPDGQYTDVFEVLRCTE